MKITIYELLGMVKDGKAPNNARIRYFDRHNDYYDECSLKENEIINRLHYGNIELNDEVEILEEPKGIPKKLKSLNNVGNVPNLVEFADKQQLNNHLIKDKLNEIIDYLDYLKSKGE